MHFENNFWAQKTERLILVLGFLKVKSHGLLKKRILENRPLLTPETRIRDQD